VRDLFWVLCDEEPQGWLGRMLSTIPIQAADQHGAALVIEPGLNVIAHMSRSVNPGIFIVRNSDFLSLSVPNQVRTTL
jgi:hypothetical protein